MRKIVDIYNEYNILPNLQEHQLRVGAVAMQICETLDIELEKSDIAIVCLLHDMGNIIKFDLNQTQVMYGISDSEIENIKKIQDEFIQKYGKDEHQATIKILKELKIDPYIIELTDAIDFDLNKVIATRETKDFSRKICCYADTRVGPLGILSIKQRLLDGKERYKDHFRIANDSYRLNFESNIAKVEKQISTHSKIKPEDITDESIKPYMEKLKDFEI